MSGPVSAQSTLTDQSSQELQRLLTLQTNKKAVFDRLQSFTVKDLMVLDDRHAQPKTSLERLMKWHDIALDTTALDHTPLSDRPGVDPRRFGEQLGPHKSSRAMAIVHIAMFEAVNALSQKSKSYTNLPAAAGSVSVDAAIAQAAHDTLVSLYPSHQIRLDELLNQDKIIADPNAIKAGRDLGAAAAASITGKRRGDHSDIAEPTVANIQPPLQQGQWGKDPLNEPAVALGGYWSQVTPFVLAKADMYRAPPPPKKTDPAYKKAFEDVRRLGGDPSPNGPMRFPTPTDRRDGETFVGVFWAYDGTPSLCAPPRLYNEVVEQIALARGVIDLDEMARLLALVNTAMADAGISAWDAKYAHRIPRPITTIRETDPKWTPLGAPVSNSTATNFTPPFPAYPSRHATFGGAVFEILRLYFQVTSATDTSFTFISDEYNGENYAPGQTKPRPRLPVSFASFTDAEYQNAQSRIFLGIHWQYDADAGIIQGRQVAQDVFKNAFQRKN